MDRVVGLVKIVIAVAIHLASRIRLLILASLLAGCLVVWQDATRAQDDAPQHRQITIANDTDATLYIQFQPATGGTDERWSKVVYPRQSLETKFVGSGFRLILVAYLTPVIRIKDLVLDLEREDALISTGEEGKLIVRVQPHLFNRYLIADSMTENPIRIVDTNQNSSRTIELRNPDVSELASLCTSSGSSGQRAVIWMAGKLGKAQHYHYRGGLLCALDGSAFVVNGRLKEHYDCDSGFTNCRVNPAKASIATDIDLSLYRRAGDTTAGPELPASIRGAHVTALSPVLTVQAEMGQGWIARYYVRENAEASCPPGYRLHYQGLCINIEDEQADDPARGVRMVDPTHSEPSGQ